MTIWIWLNEIPSQIHHILTYINLAKLFHSPETVPLLWSEDTAPCRRRLLAGLYRRRAEYLVFNECLVTTVVNHESFLALFPICGYASHNPGANLASSKKSLSFLSSASPVRGTCCKHKGAIFLFLRAGVQPSLAIAHFVLRGSGNLQHVRRKNKTQILAKIIYSLPGKRTPNFTACDWERTQDSC